MKPMCINLKIMAIICLLGTLFSCNKDRILDKDPLGSFSDASVWSDISLADRYLLNTYNCLQSGVNYKMLSNLTDESHSTHGFGTEIYVQGNITAENPAPMDDSWGGMRMEWTVVFGWIQKINVFLAHIDQVPDAYEEPEKTQILEKVSVMKGEALFLRAYCYVLLARAYGGLPILSAPFELGNDFLSVSRAPFAETVDFISATCDSAAALLLPKGEMEMGRATVGAALALKSRMLLFAASDLTADGTAANEYVGYANPDRTALWTAAKNAAKAVIDLHTYELEDFGAPDKAAVAQGYYDLFRAKDLSSTEVIWGKMFAKDVGTPNQNNLIQGTNGFGNYGCVAPTQNLVDAYQMDDGSSFFDHFMVDGNGYYKNASTKYRSPNIYEHRDPRFYGTILYDSAVWQSRYADLADRDPLGIYDRRTRVTIQNGKEVSRIFGIDTRSGPVDAEDGTYTGYVMKKFLDSDTHGSETNNNDNIWIELRYAEVLLNYAEACIGLGQTAEAATYINKIRNRAAMPDFTGDITQALRYERRIELAFEELRWEDIRRWKILDKALTNATGIDIIQTTNKDNNTVNTTWRRISVQQRGPVKPRMYWMPIPAEEIHKAPELIQNPGY